MSRVEIVTRIMSEGIHIILEDDEPILIACLRDNKDYLSTLKELHSVALFSGPVLRVYYVLEDLLPYFEKRYSVSGTPTFLLIRKGVLLDSILGKSSDKVLMQCISRHLNITDLREASSQKETGKRFSLRAIPESSARMKTFKKVARR
jgi:hypothetical protein